MSAKEVFVAQTPPVAVLGMLVEGRINLSATKTGSGVEGRAEGSHPSGSAEIVKR